ncbi:MAG TPA: alpha-E domain-containing protein [Caulobacteraceae bacterium]|nr:alpha-E domain-containing protein [Caulobacteraceae bacterium]
MMLARVADSLYWMGRYAERAEHISRLCDVMLTATLDQNDAAVAIARVALAAVDAEAGRQPAPYDAAYGLIFDRDHEGSVVTSLSRARENARQVRDQITTEMWERLNLLHLRVHDSGAQPAFANASSAFLHGVIADLHLFKGAGDATMSHGEGWRFLLAGVYLERAQLIARLLDVCFGDRAKGEPLEDHLAQMAVLRMACALEPYLRVYTAELQPRHLLQFLLFDEDFPRSIRFSTSRIEEHLTTLVRRGETVGPIGPDRLAARLSARLEFADMDENQGAGALLGAVVADCSRIHHAIYETFVAYPLEERLPA